MTFEEELKDSVERIATGSWNRCADAIEAVINGLKFESEADKETVLLAIKNVRY